jgi:hypothetical protein
MNHPHFKTQVNDDDSKDPKPHEIENGNDEVQDPQELDKQQMKEELAKQKAEEASVTLRVNGFFRMYEAGGRGGGGNS